MVQRGSARLYIVLGLLVDECQLILRRDSTSASTDGSAMELFVATAARERFPAEKLNAYRGRWVAFDDGFSNVLAAAATLDNLESVLAEQRIDPEAVYFEFIPGLEG